MLHAIKEAVKKVCPEFILRPYRSARIRMSRAKFWRQLDAENRRYIELHGVEIRHIEIETVNRCNGICPFCPVNVNQPQREYAKMTEELFRKIIDELSDMGYSHVISFYANNEPFLDERIIDFHRYANEKLPHAAFQLYTNGTLLTLEKFLEIIPLLDDFIIDNYNDRKEINSEELRKIYEYIETHPDIKRRAHFYFRLQNEVLTSRGGQAPNKKGGNETAALNALCSKPFHQLIVRPTGEISLCCNDALGVYTMGDLRTQSISEVWNSEKFRQVRAEMLANGRKNLPLCCQCDSGFSFNLRTKRMR